MQDTSPRNKTKVRDVYIKTKDLSKDQFHVSQEELAFPVLCHAQVIIIRLLRHKHLASFKYAALKCKCIMITSLNIL